MKSVLETFQQIDDLTLTELKPLGSMLGKLMEEVGELAVAVNVFEGHITHKVLDEPPVGEVADVIQCAFSILCRIYKDITPQERFKLFSEYFSNKTDKWERVQKNEIDKAHAPKAGPQRQTHDERDFAATRKRTIQIIQEQLGIWNGIIEDTSHFVNDLGADSLDLVELAMALEDEFDLDFHDDDLENTMTVGKAVELVCAYTGVDVPGSQDEITNLTDEFEASDVPEGISEDSVDDMFITTPHTEEEAEAQDFRPPLPSGYHLGYRERINERNLAQMREQEYQQNKRDTKNHGTFGD